MILIEEGNSSFSKSIQAIELQDQNKSGSELKIIQELLEFGVEDAGEDNEWFEE